MAYRTSIQGPVAVNELQLTTTFQAVDLGGNRCDEVSVYNPAGSDVIYLSFVAKGAAAPVSTAIMWVVPAGSADIVPVDTRKVDIYARMAATTTSNCYFSSLVVAKAGA